MDTIRILLIGVPRLLGDIVRSAPDDDFCVVGERAAMNGAVNAVDELTANVVVLGGDPSGLPRGCGTLLDRRPRVKVMVIRADGRRATLFELRPNATPLVELSMDELVATIRAAVRDPDAAW